MKKLLLTAALVAASSSFANVEDNFYVTGAVGMSKPAKHKAVHDFDNVDNTNRKFKPNNALIADIGVGYNITDTTRADLVFTRQFDSKAKSSFHDAPYDVNAKRTRSANAIMARVHQDVYDYGYGKLFLTGGLGIARVTEKVATNLSIPGMDNNVSLNTVTLKGKNNFAYNVAVGSSFEVQENVMLDVSLGYTDFGKAKSKKVKFGDVMTDAHATALNGGVPTVIIPAQKAVESTVKGKNLRAFSVKAGVRINL